MPTKLVFESVGVLILTAVAFIFAMVLFGRFKKLNDALTILLLFAAWIIAGFETAFNGTLGTAWPFLMNILAASLSGGLMMFFTRYAPNEYKIPTKSFGVFIAIFLIAFGAVTSDLLKEARELRWVSDLLFLFQAMLFGLATKVKLPSRLDIPIVFISMITFGFGIAVSSSQLKQFFHIQELVAIYSGDLLLMATMFFLVFGGYQYWKVNLFSRWFGRAPD